MGSRADIDVREFAELGFLADVPLFDDDEIRHYRSCFDELSAAETEEVVTNGLVDRHFDHRFIWDMATDPRLLDVIEAIAGPDLLLMATHFFCKFGDPAAKHFVAWHQDVTYWGLTPPETCSAWIAIDDVDVENGCMRFIPGSHKHGIAPHGKADAEGNILSINQEILPDHVDESRARHIPLPAGHMSVHDGHLFHSSAANRSERRRCGLAVRFVPARVSPADPDDPRWRTIPVRGDCSRSGFHSQPAPFPLPAG